MNFRSYGPEPYASANSAIPAQYSFLVSGPAPQRLFSIPLFRRFVNRFFKKIFFCQLLADDSPNRDKNREAPALIAHIWRCFLHRIFQSHPLWKQSLASGSPLPQQSIMARPSVLGSWLCFLVSARRSAPHTSAPIPSLMPLPAASWGGVVHPTCRADSSFPPAAEPPGQPPAQSQPLAGRPESGSACGAASPPRSPKSGCASPLA